MNHVWFRKFSKFSKILIQYKLYCPYKQLDIQFLMKNFENFFEFLSIKASTSVPYYKGLQVYDFTRPTFKNQVGWTDLSTWQCQASVT